MQEICWARVNDEPFRKLVRSGFSLDGSELHIYLGTCLVTEFLPILGVQ